MIRDRAGDELRVPFEHRSASGLFFWVARRADGARENVAMVLPDVCHLVDEDDIETGLRTVGERVASAIGPLVGGHVAELIYGDVCTEADRRLFKLVIGLLPIAVLMMSALYLNVVEALERRGQDERPPVE